MKYSTTITKIAPALLAAQKEIGAAKKDAENPFFHSTYADLGSVMEACKESLNKNGITVLQPIGTNECGVYVETVLLHESGEWISDGMRISPKSDTNPQDQGSAISYARRYSLQSMVFIPAEDDDANKATVIASKDKKVVEHTAQGEHFCNIHQSEMRIRNFDGQTFYDHRKQIDNVWNTCTGAGWKSQQVREVIPERQIDEERNDAHEGAMYEETIQ